MKAIIQVVLIALTASLSAAEEELIPLSFQNADVREVISLYEKLTHCDTVSTNQLVGSLTLTTAAKGVTKAKAVDLIERTLFAHGFTLVQTDKDTVRVGNVGYNPRGEGLPILTKPEEIPSGERVISYMIKLKHRDPVQFAQLLEGGLLVPNPAGFTTVVPDPTTHSVIVTERSSVLRTLLDMVRHLDVQPDVEPTAPSQPVVK